MHLNLTRKRWFKLIETPQRRLWLYVYMVGGKLTKVNYKMNREKECIVSSSMLKKFSRSSQFTSTGIHHQLLNKTITRLQQHNSLILPISRFGNDLDRDLFHRKDSGKTLSRMRYNSVVGLKAALRPDYRIRACFFM